MDTPVGEVNPEDWRYGNTIFLGGKFGGPLKQLFV